MAIQKGNSGTFNIYTHNTAISGYVAWQETYDDSNYAQTNESTVIMDVYLHRTNIYSGETSVQGVAGTRIAYFGSEEVKNTDNLWLTIAGNSSSSGGPYTKVYSASMPIKHNDDGSKQITLGYYMTNSYAVGSASNAFRVDKTTSTVTLMKIPRYGTASNSIKDSDEKSIAVNWASDNIVDYIWYRYKKSTESNYTDWIGLDVSDGTSGTYTISNLSSGTIYNIQTRIRRKDSQLTTDSSVINGETYYYPHCTGSHDFTIGQPLTLNFYNKKNRNITVKIIGNDGSEIGSWTGTDSSISGFNDSSSVNLQYKSILESTFGYFKILVTYDGHTEPRDVGNKYYVDTTQCQPNFSDFDYATDLYDLTGNYDTIVNKKTTVYIAIPTNKKATGTKHAYIKKYKVECGSIKQDNVGYSSSEEVTTSVANCDSKTIKVTAVDSRGQEKTVTKNVTNFKDYYKPSFESVKPERNNGVDTESYLTTVINFWNGNFGNGNNGIRKLSYRSKTKTSDTYGSWVSVDVSKLSYNGSKATLDKLLIHANGSSGGFAIGVAYDIQVSVIDGLESYWVESADSNPATLTDGKVGFSLLKDNDGNYHVGIDGMPDTVAPLFVKGRNPTVKISSSQPTTGEDLWVDDTNKKIYARQSNGSYKEIVAPFNNSISGNLSVSGTITAGNYQGPWEGYTWDIGTNNTSDTWIPVVNGKKIQHRVLDTLFNYPEMIGRAGTLENCTSYNQVGVGEPLNQSGLYTLAVDDWHNLINIRHRNGSGDGPNYGMQIRKRLTALNEPIEVRGQSGSWSGWERIPRYKVLYDNSSGTNGTVSLSESSANFAYLEIFYGKGTDTSRFTSTRVHAPNGKSVPLITGYASSSQGLTYFKSVSISGTSITVIEHGRQEVTSSGGVSVSASTNYVYIYKVLGWR